MKTGLLFFILLTTYLLYGLYCSTFNFTKSTNYSSNKELYHYRGVINVHSNESTGSKSKSYIINQALKTDTDFVLFTENNLKTKIKPPSYYGPLLIIDGKEVDFHKNSFQVFGNLNTSSTTQIFNYMSERTSEYNDSNLIISSDKFPKIKQEYFKTIDGYEIINLRTIWKQAFYNRPVHFIFHLLFYPFNQKLFFLKIFPQLNYSHKLFNLDNKINNKIYTIGANAKSSLKIFNKKINFPSYKNLFQMASINVISKNELSGDAHNDFNTIISSIKKGNFYSVFDYLGNPNGVTFYIKNNGIIRLNGDKINKSHHTVISCNIPHNLTSVSADLYLNGIIIKSFAPDEVCQYVPKKSGIYRFVLNKKFKQFGLIKKNLPWVFSNNFFID